jgi:phytoene dehydrogenase-like protein
MHGFWRRFTAHYRLLGGTLRVSCAVQRIAHLGQGAESGYRIDTRRGSFEARQVVSAVPAALTARLGPPEVGGALHSFLQRDVNAHGGALVVFLGVPEAEVAGQPFTHHQVLHSYDEPLGNGNNMFISVSAAGDTASAPSGYRAVMISTHCPLAEWEGLNQEEYEERKRAAGEGLVRLARRVYPELATSPVIWETATPRTYERFTRRPRGAVGGLRLSLANSNQRAVPHDIGVPGFWLVGDTTWPGLGTVACVLGSRLVAERILDSARRKPLAHPVPAQRRRSTSFALPAAEDCHAPSTIG